MSVTFHVAYEGNLVPVRGQKRAMGNIVREAGHETGLYWHERFKHQHFTTKGARLYHFKPRAGEKQSGRKFWISYTGKKKKYKGHTKPNVADGDTRAYAMAHKGVKASRNRVRVTINAPGLNRFKGRTKHGIDPKHEMTATTRDERRAMQKHQGRRIEFRMRRSKIKFRKAL